VVLHQRTGAAEADQAYWALKSQTTTALAQPMLISLPETAFSVLGTWYNVLPPTIFELPPREADSLIQIYLSAHFLWTANTASQSLCDWSADLGQHFYRSFHTVVDKTDDSSVNDTDVNFWVRANGTQPQVSITGRQYTGPLGMTVAGTQTTGWPQLQSYALITDQGPGLW
jgi:hypothetical protein